VHVAVLCGGKGTRLGAPIKCLAEVAGRPWLDWKLEQLERLGATEISLHCGPFAAEFARYGHRCIGDDQTGIRAAIAGWDGWWTMGDVLLEQPLEGDGVCFVVPGEQIAGLWLDAGLYHGRGPWRMVETAAVPYHINTPQDRERAGAYLARTMV
jgi:hypothetical protein